MLNHFFPVNKRLVLISLLIVVIGATFWGDSRYPSLNQKALMGGDTATESPLSFNAVMPSQASDPTLKRIAYTSINWAAENRNGMTFGLLFGAAFLTLFNLFQRRGSSNGFVNTLIGLGTGAPLGVCVNCAAPIAKGLHAAGARLEMTLATMFSSPTLNIVVLTMAFSIFPIYMAVIKLVLTLIFIVILIPLLCQTVFRQERVETYDDGVCELPGASFSKTENWVDAGKGAAWLYLKNLWYIVKTTLPLMILAGILGATVITFVPLNQFSNIEPGIWAALAIATLGIFLPFPIALDVVLSAAALAAGVPVFYAMIMLFTFGIYSVYPFSIVWGSISAKVAIILAVVLIILGVLGGYIADYYHGQELEAMYEFIEEQ